MLPSATSNRSGDYEEVKQRKLEELRRKLVEEKSVLSARPDEKVVKPAAISVSKSTNDLRKPTDTSKKKDKKANKKPTTPIEKPEAPEVDRSQQIYFKKLQKEVEYAIRNADANENGALDIEQLKACFQNLGYLRCLVGEQPPPMRMK